MRGASMRERVAEEHGPLPYYVVKSIAATPCGKLSNVHLGIMPIYTPHQSKELKWSPLKKLK